MQNEYINFYSNNSGQMLLFPMSGYFTNANVYPIFFNFKQEQTNDGILSYFGFEQRNAFIFGNLILFEKTKDKILQILDSNLMADAVYKNADTSKTHLSLKLKDAVQNSSLKNIKITQDGFIVSDPISIERLKYYESLMFSSATSDSMPEIGVVFVQHLASKIKVFLQQFAQCLCELITQRTVFIHSVNIQDTRKLATTEIYVSLIKNLSHLDQKDIALLYSISMSKWKEFVQSNLYTLETQRALEDIFNQLLTIKNQSTEISIEKEFKLLAPSVKQSHQSWDRTAEYVFNAVYDNNFKLSDAVFREVLDLRELSLSSKKASSILVQSTVSTAVRNDRDIRTFNTEIISRQSKNFILSEITLSQSNFNRDLFIGCLQSNIDYGIQDMLKDSIKVSNQSLDQIIHSSYLQYLEESTNLITHDLTCVYLELFVSEIENFLNSHKLSETREGSISNNISIVGLDQNINNIVRSFNHVVINPYISDIVDVALILGVEVDASIVENSLVQVISEIAEKELAEVDYQILIETSFIEMLSSALVGVSNDLQNFINSSTLLDSSTHSSELLNAVTPTIPDKVPTDSQVPVRIRHTNKSEVLSKITTHLETFNRVFVRSVTSTNLVKNHPLHSETVVFRDSSKANTKSQKPFDTDSLRSWSKVKTNIFKMIKNPRAVRNFLNAMTVETKITSVKFGLHAEVMTKFTLSSRNTEHSGIYIEPWILASNEDKESTDGNLIIFVYAEKDKKFYYDTKINFGSKGKSVDWYRKQSGDYTAKPFAWEQVRKVKGQKLEKKSIIDFIIDVEKVLKEINISEEEFSEKMIKDIITQLYEITTKEKDFKLIDDFGDESEKLKNSFKDNGISVNGGVFGTERLIFNEIVNVLLELYGRWYHLPSDGPYDEMIIPNTDYPYEQTPVNGRSVHPIEKGSTIGTTEIAVSINILANTLDFLNEVYISYYQFYNNCIPEQSLKHFVMQVHDWVTLYLPENVDKIPEYYPNDYEMYNNDQYSLEDYERLYRWIRWYAEGIIVNIDSADKNSLTGHKYVKMLITELETYFNNHHGVYGVPGKKKFDKKKGVRHKILSKFGILRDTHGSFGSSHKYLPKNDEYTRKQWKKGDYN